MNYQNWCRQATVEKKNADSVVKAWHWGLGLSLEGGSRSKSFIVLQSLEGGSCSKSFIVLKFSGKNGPSLLCSAGVLSVTNVGCGHILLRTLTGVVSLSVCAAGPFWFVSDFDHHWICWQTFKSFRLLFPPPLSCFPKQICTSCNGIAIFF